MKEITSTLQRLRSHHYNWACVDINLYDDEIAGLLADLRIEAFDYKSEWNAFRGSDNHPTFIRWDLSDRQNSGATHTLHRSFENISEKVRELFRRRLAPYLCMQSTFDHCPRDATHHLYRHQM